MKSCELFDGTESVGCWVVVDRTIFSGRWVDDTSRFSEGRNSDGSD